MAEIKFTEHDANHPQSWNLSDDDVLRKFCEVFGMRIEITRYMHDGDRYTATPVDGVAFTATRAEIVAFVRGYAISWARQRARARELVRDAAKALVEKMER